MASISLEEAFKYVQMNGFRWVMTACEKGTGLLHSMYEKQRVNVDMVDRERSLLPEGCSHWAFPSEIVHHSTGVVAYMLLILRV